MERKHPRIDFQKRPWVFGLQAIAPASSERPHRIEAKNIGLGGCKFSSNHKIPLFQEVQITIYSQMSGTILAQIKGKVVRLEEVDTGQDEKSFGIAVQFLEEPAAIKDQLVDPSPAKPS